MTTQRVKNQRGPGRPSLQEVLALVDEEVGLLHGSLGGLPRAVEADQILRQIWIDDVHNSTAIEGNTMTRSQVEDLVELGKASATVRETLEVEGYARAADWVYRTSTDYPGVPLSVVSEIHRLSLALVWEIDPPPTRDRAGAWRKSGVTVRGLRVSNPSAIQSELDAWSRSTRKAGSVHPIVHAAVHHAWFERIHPFVDGNGRVGRLILNLMLIQGGYPPAVLMADQRARYLEALRRADAGNANSLAEVIARSVSGALTRFLIPKLAGEAKLVPLSALAPQWGYSPASLRRLVLNGRLRAVREGRLWLSSSVWIKDYLSSRDPRGGPPGSRAKKS